MSLKGIAKYVKILGIVFLINTGNAQSEKEVISDNIFSDSVLVGAERIEEYLPLIKNKNIAIVANQTTRIGDSHLVDSLISLGIRIKHVFAPEHGFRGFADAGEKVDDERDPKTGLKIISLYGKNKKPKADHLEGLDVVIFDIQDVGVRFYTYISTMHYVMEACAEQGIPLIVLDRPNPNGFYVDGPLLRPQFKSFVGMHPIPLVHGMTIGEYAQMINGEGWLENEIQVELTIIKSKNYDHSVLYKLPVRPSPNLPNMTSVYLYPSLALFEGTIVSIGRGTDFPFQVIGHPDFEQGDFEFTPVSKAGAQFPKLQGQLCKGIDLSNFGSFYLRHTRRLYLFWILEMYKKMPGDQEFFNKNNFFNRLAGNAELQQQIRNGTPEIEIRASWQEDIKRFKEVRKKYLLYEDYVN